MSEELHYHEENKARPLRAEERSILEVMLGPKMRIDLDDLLVTDAKDGGMGGIKFLLNGKDRRSFGREIAQAEYIDSDNVFVSIVLDVDIDEKLLELDFWKVDFSPLKKYPKSDEIKFTTKRDENQIKNV